MTTEPAGVPEAASEETRNVRWFEEAIGYDVEAFFQETAERLVSEPTLIGHWLESFVQGTQQIPVHKFYIGMRAPVIGKPTWMWFHISTDILVTKKELEGQVRNAVEQIRLARARFIGNGMKKGRQ